MLACSGKKDLHLDERSSSSFFFYQKHLGFWVWWFLTERERGRELLCDLELFMSASEKVLNFRHVLWIPPFCFLYWQLRRLLGERVHWQFFFWLYRAGIGKSLFLFFPSWFLSVETTLQDPSLFLISTWLVFDLTKSKMVIVSFYLL